MPSRFLPWKTLRIQGVPEKTLIIVQRPITQVWKHVGMVFKSRIGDWDWGAKSKSQSLPKEETWVDSKVTWATHQISVFAIHP